MVLRKVKASSVTANRTLSAGLAGVAMMWVGAVAGGQSPIYADGVQLACSQPQLTRLSCDFRLFSPAAANAQLSASIAGRDLPPPQVTPHASEPGVTAIIFLVDTSGADRQAALARGAGDLKALVADARPHHQFALASFSGDLQVHAPLGAGAKAVEQATGELNAGGHSSEFYRNTLEAVRMVGRFQARRRAVFLLSHGLADDRAYFHKDVVEAAHRHNVAIFGLGYAKSPTLTPALQRLRRLAEETGGLYVSTEDDQPIPEGFFDAAIERLDSGGRLFVDLSSEGASLAQAGGATVKLLWRSADTSASARVPVNLAPPSAVEADAQTAADAPRLISLPPETAASKGTVSQRPAPVPPIRRPGWLSQWLLWLLAVVGLVAVVGFAVRHWRRRPSGGRSKDSPWAETLELSARSFAYLEVQDGRGNRHPVSGETFRMGRYADNELMLPDPSISRHHAEIKHELDSRFVIRDLESLNGVYVNGRKCRSGVLSNGDLIELGDVTLKFTVFAAHDRPDVETVGDGTVTPFRSKKNKGTRPV